MTENTALTDIAVTWLETLLARGVTLIARGKRLTISPKSAYAELSDAEHGTLRRHRAAIVSLVKDRYAGTARPGRERPNARPARTKRPRPNVARRGRPLRPSPTAPFA